MSALIIRRSEWDSNWISLGKTWSLYLAGLQQAGIMYPNEVCHKFSSTASCKLSFTECQLFQIPEGVSQRYKQNAGFWKWANESKWGCTRCKSVFLSYCSNRSMIFDASHNLNKVGHLAFQNGNFTATIKLSLKLWYALKGIARFI